SVLLFDTPALNGPIPEPPRRFLLRLLAGEADIPQQMLVQIEQPLTLAVLPPHAGDPRCKIAKPIRPGPVVFARYRRAHCESGRAHLGAARHDLISNRS